MARCSAFLLAVAVLTVVAMPARSEPSDATKAADKAEEKSNLRERIIGKWRLVDPEVKLTLAFSRDGVVKLTTGHFVVNGKPVPLMKDGKPIEGTLNGTYKITSDGTIDGEVESPVPSSDSKTWRIRVKPLSVSKDRLTLPGRRSGVPRLNTKDYADDESGKVTEYERVE